MCLHVGLHQIATQSIIYKKYSTILLWAPQWVTSHISTLHFICHVLKMLLVSWKLDEVEIVKPGKPTVFVCTSKVTNISPAAQQSRWINSYWCCMDCHRWLYQQPFPSFLIDLSYPKPILKGPHIPAGLSHIQPGHCQQMDSHYSVGWLWHGSPLEWSWWGKTCRGSWSGFLKNSIHSKWLPVQRGLMTGCCKEAWFLNVSTCMCLPKTPFPGVTVNVTSIINSRFLTLFLEFPCNAAGSSNVLHM